MTRDARSSIPQSHATATLPAAPSCRGTSFHPVPLQSVQFSRGIANPGFQPAFLLQAFVVAHLPRSGLAGKNGSLCHARQHTVTSSSRQVVYGALSLTKTVEGITLTGLACTHFASPRAKPHDLASTPREGPAGERASRLNRAILDGAPVRTAPSTAVQDRVVFPMPWRRRTPAAPAR